MPATEPNLRSVTTAYLAADGLLEPLLSELSGDVVTVRERLVLARKDSALAACWAQNVWHDLQQHTIASIGDGARWLRSMQRNWALYSLDYHRRAALLEDKLPPLRPKPRAFPSAVPTAPLGSWTLWRSDLMLASARCSSPFRHGEVTFVEDKLGPPSRAYLKLWEALTLLGHQPGPGDRCVDLGASPGGWTWVLGMLGARVLAVDKAPLDPVVAAMPGIETRQESAFAIAPESIGPVDWLFSDVICYPQRLFELVQRWRQSGMAKRFVCTVKFQGVEHYAAAREFLAIEGARLVHLHHNKHELTLLLSCGLATSG